MNNVIPTVEVVNPWHDSNNEYSTPVFRVNNLLYEFGDFQVWSQGTCCYLHTYKGQALTQLGHFGEDKAVEYGKKFFPLWTRGQWTEGALTQTANFYIRPRWEEINTEIENEEFEWNRRNVEILPNDEE